MVSCSRPSERRTWFLSVVVNANARSALSMKCCDVRPLMTMRAFVLARVIFNGAVDGAADGGLLVLRVLGVVSEAFGVRDGLRDTEASVGLNENFFFFGRRRCPTEARFVDISLVSRLSSSVGTSVTF